MSSWRGRFPGVTMSTRHTTEQVCTGHELHLHWALTHETVQVLAGPVDPVQHGGQIIAGDPRSGACYHVMRKRMRAHATASNEKRQSRAYIQALLNPPVP